MDVTLVAQNVLFIRLGLTAHGSICGLPVLLTLAATSTYAGTQEKVQHIHPRTPALSRMPYVYTGSSINQGFGVFFW